MASSDSSQFTSSADIFSANHTLPQIRTIHKNLHVQIDEKASRLRTQVGSSYRELLGTADTIVHMRGDNDVVQELLGKMGGRCGRAVIGAKASGLANFVAAEDKLEASVAARLRLADACLLNAGRVLRGGATLGEQVTKGDRLVLATKVMVLARLLIKNVSEDTNDDRITRSIETTKTSWETLRRKLSSSVNKVLQKTGDGTERDDVLKALCAYSLANSSGSKDVLRHFLSVRGSAIALAFQVGESERERSTADVVRSLRLYARTLLDVQALVPAKLSTGLSGLKSRPLLADPGLKQLEGLRLDMYERWCSEEVQYFTPFIRHDDLEGKQAREMLMSWSDKGANVLLDGLNKTLQQMTEFKMIIDLRTEVLELWIRDGGKVKGIDASDMQNDLREAINSRMLAVLDIKVSKLRLVGSEVSAALAKWKDGITDEHVGLWDDEGYETAFSGGAAPFVQEVVSRLYGRNDAVSKATHSYKAWYRVIDDVKEVVESLRRQRWDNDYDEIEDEETIEERQQILSKDDPKLLQERLDTALDKSFHELDHQVSELWNERSNAPNSGAIAMYFLRVIRDIRHQLPQRKAIEHFGLSIVPALHSKVATSVSASALGEFASSGLSVRKAVGRPLWDGEPPLPSQPSPEIFQFLRNLSLAMSEAGIDLWSPAAATVMKEHLSQRLCAMWRDVLEKLSKDDKESSSASKTIPANKKEKESKAKKNKNSDETQKNGQGEVEEPNEDEDTQSTEDEAVSEKPKSAKTSEPAQMTEEERADLMTQWLFDVALLQRFVGSPAEGVEKGFKELEEALYERTQLDDKSIIQRIAKASQDFWQRTSLLFGLFA